MTSHELKIIAEFDISDLELDLIVKRILFSSGKGQFKIKEVRVKAIKHDQ